MPSAVGGISLEQVQHNLQQCLARKDAAGAQAQLQKAKLILLQQNSLVPSEGVPVGQLKTARSVLEVGALLAIRRRDPDSFVRYYSQLQPFYEFSGLQSSPSPNKSQVTGLYLLLLLSQGDYAGFHTLLESLIVSEGISGGKSVEDDIYIKYPVDLERSLMEGSYDQVWRKTSGRDVPGEEFALFSEVCCTRCARLTVSDYFRSSFTQSDPKLLHVQRDHILHCLLRRQRTSSSSTRKVPYLNLHRSKDGV